MNLKILVHLTNSHDVKPDDITDGPRGQRLMVLLPMNLFGFQLRDQAVRTLVAVRVLNTDQMSIGRYIIHRTGGANKQRKKVRWQHTSPPKITASRIYVLRHSNTDGRVLNDKSDIGGSATIHAGMSVAC